MSIWQINYFPPAESNNSAFEYVSNLGAREGARIAHRLELIASREISEWRNLKWLKIWQNKIWQLDGTQTRLMFVPHHDTSGRKLIVVLHAFKKDRQKTPPLDEKRTHRHYTEFQARYSERA